MEGVKTQYGTLVPQYEDDGVRRKYKQAVTYYSSGELESIVLQSQTKLLTVVGELPAEYVTFYPSGNVKRVFPLNGKITGYWTEEDELQLAQDLSFEFPFGKLKGKVIGIYFYDGGGIKSLTFWPAVRWKLPTAGGVIETRIGVSFYPDGSIASCEPANPVVIETKIGKVRAYDPTAIGINGDRNSLQLTERGDLQAVVTSSDAVEVTDKSGKKALLTPALKPNLFNPEAMDILPLKIVFQNDKVVISHKDVGRVQVEESFSLTDHSFRITPHQPPKGIKCSTCANCTACG